jgi:hypothetical protein
MVLSRLPNPIQKARDVKNDLEERNHKKLFYEEQFQKMVSNGNYEKAVDLIWDEARNLNVRIENEIPADELAQYCFNRLYHADQELDHREEGLDELENSFEIE